MNEKVQEFLQKKQEEFARKEKERRDKVLIDAGLCTLGKVYSEQAYAESLFDIEQNKYYTIKHCPIDVTDEEFAQIEKALKDADEMPANEVFESSTAEGIVKFCAALSLIVGIISVIVCIVIASNMYKGGGSLILSGTGILFVCLIQWAILKILAGISENLRRIERNTKR